MQIQDPQIIRLIDRIGQHYRANIANRFIRPFLLLLPLENPARNAIENFMEKGSQLSYQGYEMEDLYHQIAAAAQFVFYARRDMPSIRSLQDMGHNLSGSDRVLKEMALNNLNSNLKVLADLLYELYIKLVDLDKAQNPRNPIYTQIADLVDIGHQLVGS
jgi:citrate synthase